VIAASVVVAAALLAQEPFGATPREVNRTAFGRFALVEREMILSEPVLHGPRGNWTELRLEFQDGEDHFAVVDNGRMLGIQLDSGTCITSGGAMGFAGEMGEPAIFRDFLNSVGLHDLGCPARGRAALRRHQRQLGAVRTDFAAGIEALKRRAESVYPDGWRCRVNFFGRRNGPIAYLPNARACGVEQ
jgi:hypothetical protein